MQDRIYVSWFSIVRRVAQSQNPRVQSLRKFLIFSIFATLILMGFSSFLNSYISKYGQEKIASQLLAGLFLSLPTVALSVSSSAVAASLFEFFHKVNEEWGKENVQLQLRQLFNCDDVEAISQSVAIVLPARLLRNMLNETAHDQSEEGGLEDYDWINEAQRDLYRLQRPAANSADVIAAASVISAFSEAGLPTPTIIFDNEVIRNKDLDRDISFKVLISIGLYSNRLTCWINESEMLRNSQEKYFKLYKGYDNPDQARFRVQVGAYGRVPRNESNQDNGRTWMLVEDRIWSNFEAVMDLNTNKLEGEIDYALLAKIISVESGKTFILLGGAGEDGTECLGKYVAENWKEILDRLLFAKGYYRETGRRSVEDGISNCSFAQVFTISSRRVTIGHTCIRPLNV